MGIILILSGTVFALQSAEAPNSTIKMNEKKLFEHGELYQEDPYRENQVGEITEHLYRLWQLFPKADPDKIIKPVETLQSWVVYREIPLAVFEEVKGETVDFSNMFDKASTTLIQ